MTAAERSTLGEYVTMLNEVIDVWSVLAEPAVAPKGGSPAAEEFRAVREERADR